MIEAVIFDLDGTLVQTESLKAISYGRAAVELTSGQITEEEVVEAFKEVVGLSRQEVAQALIQRFDLEEAARSRLAEFNVRAPWQAFVQVRLQIYNRILSDPEILHEHVCPYNIGFLRYARKRRYQTGLATMSHCAQVNRVLGIIGLEDEFDFIASRDDVENGKPDPEIYNLVARELATAPANCLVIEDSPTGVKAALAANMHCIVVTTDFTRAAIHRDRIIDKRWIVNDPANLESVARALIKQTNFGHGKRN